MNYCIQCEHCKATNEVNLYMCNLVPHMVCGETVECKDFKAKQDLEDLDFAIEKGMGGDVQWVKQFIIKAN